MRVYSLLYKNLINLKYFVKSNQLIDTKKYLVIIHTDNLTKTEISPLIKSIGGLLPNAEVIGCSVGGIIYKGESLINKTLITIIDLYDTAVKTTSIKLKDENGYRPPQKVADDVLYFLDGANDSFLFTYYCPTYPYVSQLVEEFNKRSINFRLIGGGAYSVAGDLCKEPAYIVHNNFIAEDYIVTAKLKSNLLLFNQAAITGIKSVGRSYKVTKSKEHRLIEVDNQPAKQWFNYLVGEEYLKEDKNIIHALPLVNEKSKGLGLNINYDYDALTGEELGGDLFVFDEIRENDCLTMGYIDPNSTFQALKPLCEEISSSPTEALFAYSCLTRRLILHNCAKWELKAFTSTQITGAFMAGELIYDGTQCRYSNSAFTVAALSEDPNATVYLNLHELQDSTAIQFDNLPLVSYLFSTANSELKNEIYEGKQRLAEQMVTDTETGLANLAKYVFDAKNEGFNSLCLLSLKNENVIRVFLSKDVYSSYVLSAADACKRILGAGYSVYRYGELSVLIAANTQDKDSFVAGMKRLKAELDSIKYDNYQPIYEMSIVFGEDDILNKVELTYVNLHKGSGDMLINSEEENNDFQKEMMLLQVINDAIAHNRVIPYYQGIMNNNTQQIDIYESLMRITDKDGKIYMPGEFLPVAKEYKLYDRLSQTMIAKVLDDVPKHPFIVTINLNTSDLYNQETLKLIFDKLEQSESPEKVIFEIVESEALTDYTYLKTFTDKIHSLGAKIAVDDFGSGYSNLMHVLRIDLDYIKITGEIVRDVHTDPSCCDFITMISSWANTRDKKVIAEYVENEPIQEVIKQNNVDYSQGYLFSRPAKLEEKS
ncbi:MAG: EAL domain-containing protein [Candidatus Coproplasma sp.]